MHYHFIRILLVLVFSLPVFAKQEIELLRNGDFESGITEEREPDSFIVKGWRRQLWKLGVNKVWLTSGKYDSRVGANNKAMIFTWDAATVYQDFSAGANNDYSFSINYMNADNNDSRWIPQIQVQWFDANYSKIGTAVTVAKPKKKSNIAKKWIKLEGIAKAPAKTGYGQIRIVFANSGSGKYFQRHFVDNVSVIGKPGTANLPVSFVSGAYDLNLDPIFELDRFAGTLTTFAEDGDDDLLKFSKISGPDWLEIKADGSYNGVPEFDDVGDNVFTVKVTDNEGSYESRKITIGVIGLLRLSHLFNDNMVLQRNHAIGVGGSALPNKAVTVKLGDGKSVKTMTNAKGIWKTTLPASKAGGPYGLTVSSGSREVQLKNVMVGDVWLCTGQSNMSWPLKNTTGAAKEIAQVDNPQLRIVTIPNNRSSKAEAELADRTNWQVATSDTVGEFSAVGYYFGKELEANLDIPIGLISANQGGTRIETWVRSLNNPSAKIHYNAMIHPFTQMPIKGVIWYQGEANLADGDRYIAKMEALAKQWREGWGIGEFPIYFAQLASFDYGGNAVYKLPEMWAAQATAAKLIPNCAMAVINDVSDITNIHPQNKIPVGNRLARLARYGTYGQKDVIPCGPVFREVKREGNSLIVKFDYAGKGLSSRDEKPLNWFEIAGADKVYVKAKAKIDGDSVLVSAPGVREPQWVRFGWHEIAEPNLVNSAGLPGGAFEASLENSE